MIHLTRLNHVPIILNSDLIEHIEVTPDTVITLTTGQKIMVLESSDEVMRRTIDFRRGILKGILYCKDAEQLGGERPDGGFGLRGQVEQG